MRLLLAIARSMALSLNGLGAAAMAGDHPQARPAADAEAAMDQHDCGAPCDCCGDETSADMSCQAACAGSMSLAVPVSALPAPAFTSMRRRRPPRARLRAQAPDPPRRPPRLVS
jgi:hypothetical protein